MGIWGGKRGQRIVTLSPGEQLGILEPRSPHSNREAFLDVGPVMQAVCDGWY